MTLTKAMVYGLILGTTFTIGAAIADILYMRQLPRHDIFLDPATFHETLQKATP